MWHASINSNPILLVHVTSTLIYRRWVIIPLGLKSCLCELCTFGPELPLSPFIPWWKGRNNMTRCTLYFCVFSQIGKCRCKIEHNSGCLLCIVSLRYYTMLSYHITCWERSIRKQNWPACLVGQLPLADHLDLALHALPTHTWTKGFTGHIRMRHPERWGEGGIIL